MNADVFLDTNILLYSIDEDPASLTKRQRAQELMLSERWGWSIQVAAEFFVNATSPKRPFRLAATTAAALVEGWLALPTLDVTPALFRAAVAVQQRHQLSYWDAAIVAAAKEMRCDRVYSEDLNAGQNYDGVTVVNPFAAASP
ncbi:MAG TPA: PIN domain-containing protein [Tepidisphaeraceae bacterium]|jgi:predicted nucleic acid-binding protein|nr:PIN domain-containing protein [Tepidisphaeraceae bacterium]